MSNFIDSIMTLLPMAIIIGVIVAVAVYIIKHPEKL
jgi:hypothetical protein